MSHVREPKGLFIQDAARSFFFNRRDESAAVSIDVIPKRAFH